MADFTTILIWAVVSAVAGWLSSLVMKANWRRDLLTDIIVGILGGLIGGFVLGVLDVGGDVTGSNLASIATAFISSVLLLAFMRVLRTA